ncbi:LytR/AlgR family response regulator transcription factor [Pseudoteredinibacter isoporae]|uniref:DNA-binding LytR/AlgR family response regulator n=1 Tax=Pseudoteredinibacter isoporae TaxID=570281 RepID=A0A7X0JRU8_9GAMM|nr:LytTR family DNA-binding domain-containing protein [Pseudoteredinibacter isoporae]MBB6521139.1 DNA-binding LytR/AlgR family response regulator [Pseudoteredinibacter isoporae]NHO86700.1 response regulator transcription factor [Pseudoteredinibacter isoporae]NIB24848.1 response regulator transcription factor [Pseudoteredinibacter isoporae]
MTSKRYQCLIVDDESLGRELIAAHLQQLPQFDIVSMCSSAIEASQILNQKSIDLLFLDIEMPVLKGTDFYGSLTHKPKVIFTTAHRDYALDGFELEAVDYLLKPITFSRFFKAVERFLAQQESPKVSSSSVASHLFVRCDRKEVKIYFDDVLYIRGLKDYIEIHTTKRKLVVKSSLSSFFEKLPSHFIKTHRSYIVNPAHISAYTKHDIEIDDREIPIGDSFQDDVLKRIL